MLTRLKPKRKSRSRQSNIRAKQIMHMNIPALLVVSLLVISAVPAYAHFEHFSHYNGKGDGIGPYYVYEALEPDYAAPNEPAAIMFSVQDHDGRDTYNLETMVEIYASSGERLKA